MFSCEFYEISKNTFSTEHLWATAPDSTSLRFYTGSNSVYDMFEVCNGEMHFVGYPFCKNNPSLSSSISSYYWVLKEKYLNDVQQIGLSPSSKSFMQIKEEKGNQLLCFVILQPLLALRLKTDHLKLFDIYYVKMIWFNKDFHLFQCFQACKKACVYRLDHLLILAKISSKIEIKLFP